MRYHALACDYDGTLALRGRVDGPTLAALERLLATGRKLILVTGRELDELMSIFPEIEMFAWVVAENGALLYRPADRQTKLLGKAPPPGFAQVLRERGVSPLSVGRVIVATWHPHETVVLDVIRDLGLEMQVIFNKDAVMVLPSGVNKATGLAAALEEMKLSPHEVVAVGDAENDHALMSLCECGVAVANALPAVQERADLVTRGDHGAGVAELIEQIIGDDLAGLEGRLTRHHLLLGAADDGHKVHLPPYGHSVLIAGPSGSGKSTAATSFLERLIEHRYQFCIIDPEGDYENLNDSVVLGTSHRGPTVDEVLRLVETSRENTVLNLVGLPLADRPPFFLALLPRLQELRVRTGRPHWLVVDEAHHLLPTSWQPGPQLMPGDLRQTLFITVHPGQVSPGALSTVDTVIAVGTAPEKTVGQFCAAVKERPPSLPTFTLKAGEILLWRPHADPPAARVHLVPSHTERRRHIRKYAEGELPPERSFYFRGPEGKLNLRAQNLILFMQMADGVDDATWLHHLQQGDYSTWFRECIKNEELAAEAAEVEQRPNVSAQEGRQIIRALIERHYTLPAAPPLPMPGTDARPKRQ